MDDLRALLAAATPGPWCYESIGEKGDGCNIVGVAFAPDDEDCKSPLRGRLPEWTEDGKEIEYYRDEDVCVVEHRSRGHSANTELIVAAVNALPALLDRIAAVERDAERMRIERDHSRAQYEHAIKVLVAIHAVMPPPHIKLADGRTMEFNNPAIEHEMLHALAERIRSIPDEIAAIAARKGEG